METVIYDTDYLSIPFQDMPEKDNLIICHDPQKRLNSDTTPVTWAVLHTTADDGDAAPFALGLFWSKEQAITFADALSAT